MNLNANEFLSGILGAVGRYLVALADRCAPAPRLAPPWAEADDVVTIPGSAFPSEPTHPDDLDRYAVVLRPTPRPCSPPPAMEPAPISTRRLIKVDDEFVSVTPPNHCFWQKGGAA
jgi:hypothetical protein